MSKSKSRNSFSFIEVLVVLVILSVIASFSFFKQNNSNLQLATQKIILYLNYTRYISHIDNKEDSQDAQWQKKLWTLKFQNCSSAVGGLYYVVYSDTSGGTSHFKKSECLKDPTSNKYLYSNNDCDASGDESKYILLTKEYGVTKVELKCNTTGSIGQISFGYDGKIYSSLGDSPKEITTPCNLTLYDKNGDNNTIVIEPKTGYIHNL